MSKVLGIVCLLLFVLIVATCSTKDPKLQQYYVQGEQLYLKHCSNCHQKDGSGLGLVYPPVNQSDFVDQRFEEVLCLMKFGKEGDVLVNGKSYNQPMPGNPLLTDLEIAEIATYLYNHWGRERGLVEVQSVKPVLDSCRRLTDHSGL